MHIMVLTYEFYPDNGGVGNASMSLCQALRKHLGATVSVAACVAWWSWEPPLKHEHFEGLDIYRIKYTGIPEERPLRQSLRTLRCFVELMFLAQKLKPDVIISQRVFDLGLAGVLLAKMVRAVSITYAHGPDDIQHTDLRPFRKRLNRLAMKWNDATVTTNSAYADALVHQSPDTPVAIIPNIVDNLATPGMTDPAYRELDGAFHIGCAGRLVVEHGVETKGFSDAIRAMTVLPECRLHVYGAGEHGEELRYLAATLNVSDRMIFHGKLERTRLVAELQRLDLLLHPALFEGLPMVVLEAMLVGLPVAASDAGGLKDLVRDRETGLRVQTQNPESIADAVRFVQRHPEEVKRFAQEAQKHVQRTATGEAVAENFRRIIEAVSQ